LNSVLERYFVVLFPLLFAALWLLTTTFLAALSGWFRLMASFPDPDEEALLRMAKQSGSMGLGVSMNGILTLSVRPSGIRVGIMRVFGPFSRDFFVPRQDLNVTRKFLFSTSRETSIWQSRNRIADIPAYVANQLARTAMRRWPETGPFPVETHRDTLRRLLIEWGLISSTAGLFFTLVPLLVAPAQYRPSIAFAILLPTVFFGVVTGGRYFRERN
jgi:hypothetical protein